MSLKQFARWTLPLPILTLTLIAGCATAPSKPPPTRATCSTVLPYAPAELASIATEKATLQVSGVIRGKALPDYERMRDEARACAGATK